MSVKRQPLYIGNDNDIYVLGLRLASTKAYVNDATMTVTLKDSLNATVSGASALTMDYQSGTDGDYRGVIPGTVTLTAGANYTAIVTGTSPVLRWEIPLRATARDQ